MNRGVGITSTHESCNLVINYYEYHTQQERFALFKSNLRLNQSYLKAALAVFSSFFLRSNTNIKL